MTLNFHDFDYLLEKGRSTELKPISVDDMKRYAIDPSYEEDAINRQSRIQGFDKWAASKGTSGILTKSDSDGWETIRAIDVGVRQQ